jgi:hypothetical protein
MPTILTKPLFPFIFACTALLGVYQQAAAQTPIKETMTQTTADPGTPPDNAQKMVYGCDFAHENQSITAEVSEWRAPITGKLHTRVTRVHLTKYPNSSTASANLIISAPSATTQTHSNIPMDGNWHASTIYVVGDGGASLQGNMERPYQNGCILYEKKK